MAPQGARGDSWPACSASVTLWLKANCSGLAPMVNADTSVLGFPAALLLTATMSVPPDSGLLAASGCSAMASAGDIAAEEAFKAPAPVLQSKMAAGSLFASACIHAGTAIECGYRTPSAPQIQSFTRHCKDRGWSPYRRVTCVSNGSALTPSAGAGAQARILAQVVACRVVHFWLDVFAGICLCSSSKNPIM